MLVRFKGKNIVIPKPTGEYYTYLYLDPLKNIPFYIGKGKNDRYKVHLRENINTTKNLLKYNKIQKIIKNNKEPIIIFIQKNISEKAALTIEKYLINSLGTVKNKTGPLSNILINEWTRNYDNDDKHIYKKIGDKIRLQWKNPNSGYSSKKFRETSPFFVDKSGEKNPNYNNKWSLEKRKKVSTKLKKEKTHAGSNNANAKLYKLTSPNNEIFFIDGGLEKFCLKNNLMAFTLKKNKNKYVEYPRFNRKTINMKFRLNTIGWKLEEVLK